MRATILITSTVFILAGLPVADAGADEIEDMINQASLEEYQSYLRVLTGVDSVPGSDPPYYLEDRYSRGAYIHVAGQWILDHFDSLGLVASSHEFNLAHGPNVIGELPGTVFPEEIYIYCAHYDAVEDTPGCDDNGSGTGSVMMAARILSQYQFTGTIRFVAFAGEEQGMVGSRAYAEAARAAGENIVAAINLDMILHPSFDNQEPDPDYDLDISGNNASQWLAQDVATQFGTYTPIDFQVHNDSTGGSDHWAFWLYGYDAIELSENTVQEIWGGSNNAYHRPSDRFGHAHWDWDFALETIRGSMAGLVTLAGPLNCPDDYDCDGIPDAEDNCPSHRNADQLDCDDDGYGDICTIAECEDEAWCGDCNENGIPDGCDIAGGISDDYDLNGIPDECEDCNGNGVPDACDLDCGTGDCASHPLGCGTSADCNGNWIPDECDLADGTSADCQPNGVPDECDIADGISDDYDLDGIPDECDRDCNENGIPDACDVDCGTGDCASHPLGCGTSADCQPDGIPDECQLAGEPIVTVVIFTDYFPSETVWVLVEQGGGATASGGPYSDPLTLYTQDVPVIPGGCYDFTIYDAFGDGICCFYGAGYYEVYYQGYLVASGGEFGSLETVADVGGCGTGYGDCNDNGVPEECDIAAGVSDAYDLNGIPDECDPDCNENGIPDTCDIDCGTGDCASHPLGCGTSADCNGNGTPDDCDIADGISDDYDLNGVPDECEDCNGNGVPDACDLDCGAGNCLNDPLGCGTSADCNGNGKPDDCDIADGTSADCQPNGVPDECDIAAGTSDDYDLDGVPDECQDCNGNGVPDACDLDCSVGDCASHPLGCGTSADCNGNGIPDECIDDEDDCNDNGVPDQCDIADGTSRDVNGNTIPDECECLGDLNHDNQVDVVDLALLLQYYGTTSGASHANGDIDADGDVDLADLAWLLGEYGTTCA